MDLEILGIASVGVITALVYVLAEVLKNTKINNKWIPSLCGAFGIPLGAVGYFVMADFPASDVLSACAVGAASGLAATGINQIIKQLKRE